LGAGKLFQLFDYRYIARLPTVMTTASFKEDMDPRLLSRLEDARLCTICAITVPNYRGQPAEIRKGGSGKRKRGGRT
jgi:hypothetical protein